MTAWDEKRFTELTLLGMEHMSNFFMWGLIWLVSMLVVCVPLRDWTDLVLLITWAVSSGMATVNLIPAIRYLYEARAILRRNKQ